MRVVNRWEISAEYKLVRFEMELAGGEMFLMRLTEVQALRLADALNDAAHLAIAHDPRAQVP